LQSDALRRANQTESADEAWARSVSRAADCCGLTPCLFDPAYWDAASYLRPVKASWPPTVIVGLAPLSPLPSYVRQTKQNESEAIVWGAIGQALLDRGDNESALLSLKHAETAALGEVPRGWVRLAQANALARVGQTSAATALLASCVSNADPKLASAASASLGTIKCHSGDAEAGYRLLHKAVQSQKLDGWIGEADAEADYGLACLMRGDEKTGLQWLHSAQSRYESQGEVTRLVQSLSNEREYWKVRKQKARATEIETRIASLQ
jgi:hypothetical protein